MVLKLIGQFSGDGISVAGITFIESDWLIESTVIAQPASTLTYESRARAVKSNAIRQVGV